MLHALATREFLKIYRENDQLFGVIPSFLKHQVINNKEADSPHPEPNEINYLTRDEIEKDAYLTRAPRVPQGKEGKGKEGNSKESLSGKPDHADTPAGLIIYLNEKTGSNFQPVESNINHLKARIEEGRTADEVRKVIDNRVDAWLENDEMAKYLRPATLFNATKFNQYYGQLSSSDGENYRGAPPGANLI